MIDSISQRRAPTAGRPDEAEQMDKPSGRQWLRRVRTVARMATEEYGLTASIHAARGALL
jgi:inosose dehydratase